MEKRTVIFLGVIFVVAYFLRVMYLPQNSLTFGYDQARDAYQSLAIANGDIKIQGPSSSTPGLFHGVFYYYLLAPAYLLGAGSPIVAAMWIALLNSLTMFLVFYLSYRLTKSLSAGFFSSILFAVSFESTQYAVWLSNPTIAIWTIPLFYIGLWNWLKENKSWGAMLAGVGLGLSVQSEIFLLYHIVPGLLIAWMAKKSINRETSIKFFGAFLVSVFTMILTEVKFGFKGLSGFQSLLSSSDAIGFSGKSFGDYLLLYFNQLGRVLAYSIYPGNVWVGALFGFILIILALYSWNKKSFSWQPLILVWILSSITVVGIGGTSTPFLLVGIAPAISILVGISLSNLWKSREKLVAILILSVIVFANVSMIIKENVKGQTIFAIQKDMLLSKQLSAIDYTYDLASGEEFSINSLTSPLWVNIVWTYLYEWHGERNYGYIPYWHGRDQVGQLKSLPTSSSDIKKRFLILEPMAGIPARYLGDTVGFENVSSKVLEEKNFGEIVVEYRQLHKLND